MKGSSTAAVNGPNIAVTNVPGIQAFNGSGSKATNEDTTNGTSEDNTSGIVASGATTESSEGGRDFAVVEVGGTPLRLIEGAIL